ncbi:MAG: V-type ATP synthase subunit A [Euryarchaeota archaeon RBG_19FT_COMBO_69_17]|nr:MAG: V-type ATP synthase subunit A [Euryarchaeota archaeon RBG_19FT_COMBO_69_17]
MKARGVGEITRVAGPVITAAGLSPRMYDVVLVGAEQLMGEVIKITGDKTTIQVYEETSGVRPGEPVVDTGRPLTVELGPGLLGNIYDGIQRPLPVLQATMGDFILRGVQAPGLSRDKLWDFKPSVKEGDLVKPGQVLGTVPEAKNVEHRVLVPPRVSGKVARVRSGKMKVDDVAVELDGGAKLMLKHDWPVRRPRPVKDRLMPTVPLITGQRVMDFLFPIAKGGTAAIPGGFGTGKTVSEQQLSKWCDAQVVIYIGCGERGNEMTEVLTTFPKLEDPYTGAPLMDRMALIANTSNMPVAAREASVYTGMTLAEYYRDMGYNVALMADSTSRWAEAMRELSSRLEEMPGEEGFPAHLSARLSEFYERAGRVTTLNDREGSVSVVGAVSPSGGDFSEPVTQGTLRIVKVFWALDTALRARRHFPAINWLTSYSLYVQTLEEYFRTKVNEDWPKLRQWTQRTLQEEAELEEIVRLVGADALPPEQQLTLEVARMIREIFLQQNAYHPVDTFCPPERQFKLISSIKRYADLGGKAVALDVPLKEVAGLKSRELLTRVKYEEKFDAELEKALALMEDEFKKLEVR